MAPTTMKAVLLEQAVPAPHLATLTEIPIPALEENQALIKVRAVSVNHRELWILKGFYPVKKTPHTEMGIGRFVSTRKYIS